MDRADRPIVPERMHDMDLRSERHPLAIARRLSGRRRTRRRRGPARELYCRTNGCTTFLVPDAEGKTASCPVCGARRRIG